MTPAISVSVFRNEFDSTNNGLSNTQNRLILVAPDATLGFPILDLDKEEDYLVLTEGPYKTLRAVPKSLLDADAWVLFGGNFAYCSDSRFSALNNGNPIKIFDRVEEMV